MIAYFLYSLSGGMLGVLATGKLNQIAWKFLRVASLLAFAMLAVVTVWAMQDGCAGASASRSAAWWSGVVGGMAAIGVVLLAPVAKRWPRLFRVFCGIGAAGALAAACRTVLADLYPDGPSWRLLDTAVCIDLMLGAFLLGSITIAWLLGHAYLTATKMTIAPLRHFTRVLAIAVAVRIAFLVASIAAAWLVGVGEATTIFTLLANSWIVATLRIGLGIVAVAAFAYMVADCVRLRSTQSATGILYFGSVFAYIGELAGRQLLTETGWPL